MMNIYVLITSYLCIYFDLNHNFSDNSSSTRQPEPEFKMQFKFIASVFLFFITQTMATPIPQPAQANDTCTLPSTVFALTVIKVNHTFSWAGPAGKIVS
jgi:hypothetical protein